MSVENRGGTPVALDGPAVETLWATLRADAERIVIGEPFLARLMQRIVLERTSFVDALATVLSEKFACDDATRDDLFELASSMMERDPAIAESAAIDLIASVARDPAYNDHVTPFAYAKGFQALEWHRVAHALWTAGRRELATYLEGRMNDVFGIDIHPGARFGRGVFIDHGTGVVIGETATIGDDVSILHGVTLGGTGKDAGDRHPKVGRGVLLGTGATVLGNVTIGEGASVAAGSVVLRPVPPWTTVAGIPARIVRQSHGELPAQTMDQDFFLDFQI
ncbi:MAG TPA: serine O-acetyltransferase [Candidatus Elarobacter sp.]